MDRGYDFVPPASRSAHATPRDLQAVVKRSVPLPPEWQSVVHNHVPLPPKPPTSIKPTSPAQKYTTEECMGEQQSSNKVQQLHNESAAIFKEMQNSLRGKIAATQATVDTMNNTVDTLNSSIAILKENREQMVEAMRAKEGAQALCTWRMGQREKRPLRELSRDAAAVAIEEERNAYFKMDTRLNEALRVNLLLMSTLATKRDRLKHDISHKTQAMKVDELHLATHGRRDSEFQNGQIHGGRSMPLTGEPPLPAGARPASGRPATPGSRPMTPCSGPRSRPQSAGSSMGSRPRSAGLGGRKLESARSGSSFGRDVNPGDLCEENKRLIQYFERLIMDAKVKTEKVLEEHVAEMHIRRNELAEKVMDTKQKHHHTKATISDTRMQMESLEEPMALCSLHSSWKVRGPEEQTKDPVEARLEEQKFQLLRTTKELRHHRKIEKSILTELGDQMQRQQEELQDKTMALAIDVMCLNQAKSKFTPSLISGRLPSAGSIGRPRSRPQSARAY